MIQKDDTIANSTRTSRSMLPLKKKKKQHNKVPAKTWCWAGKKDNHARTSGTKRTEQLGWPTVQQAV